MKYILIVIIITFSCLTAKSQKIFSVDYASQADIKIYVSDYESMSDLSVFKVDTIDFLGSGGWSCQIHHLSTR